MAELRRLAAAVTTAALLGVAVAACGVSTSDPVDLGDGLVAGVPQGSGGNPRMPGPDEASSPEDLVKAYLSAGVEMGPEQPVDRLKSFLTRSAREALALDPKNSRNPLVIRLIGEPVRVGTKDDRADYEVRYEVVGTLNDQGRVDNLLDPRPATPMQFWVRPNEDRPNTNRIDEIDFPAAPVMITDAALATYYQVQPVYFWDSTNSRLIPDIRYMPYGLAPDLRAARIVQWLIDSPSNWLPGALRLPTGVAVKNPVQVRQDHTVVVSLNTQAAFGGDVAVVRLFRQLQWSLQADSSATRLELDIDDKPVDPKLLGAVGDYLPYNLSAGLPARGARYDIVDGKVVALGASSLATTTVAQPAVFTVKENQGVAYAAVNRAASAAVLVRSGTDGRRSVQIVRDGVGVRTVDGFPGRTAEVGRPVFLDGGHFLLPYAGRLYEIATTGGAPVDVTPGNRVGSVRSASLSPDGRRLAFVADGQAYVASLNVGDNGIVTVGASARQLLAGQVSAVAVAWISEGWLYVTGTSIIAGEAQKPVMYRATADSVIAINESAALAGIHPTDVVAFPTGPFISTPPEVYVCAGAVVYPFFSQLTQDASLHAPFFGA